MTADREVNTEAEVIAWVQAMADCCGGPTDDEGLHYEQDSLFRAVLRAVVESSDDPIRQAMAAAALTVDDLEFERWYA